ncbi:MAG: hypothetical protein ACI4VQ_00180 [Clostridia bacterium]
MDGQNLEEEIDILEYTCDVLDTITIMLKNLSSEEYNIMISQCQELLNDIDYILIDKQEQLNRYNKQQLLESRLERYEREIEYRKMQGF